MNNCVQAVHHVGSTEYVNVCSGELAILQWGTMDWALFVIGWITAASVVLLLLVICYSVIAMQVNGIINDNRVRRMIKEQERTARQIDNRRMK